MRNERDRVFTKRGASIGVAAVAVVTVVVCLVGGVIALLILLTF